MLSQSDLPSRRGVCIRSVPGFHRWDSYARLVEPLAATVPWMTITGNHEVESPTGYYGCGASMNVSFASYDARYGAALPFAAGGSPSPHFYSFEAAGVHWVMLGAYDDYAVGSPQLAWLAEDLAGVDRARTPWLIATVRARDRVWPIPSK